MRWNAKVSAVTFSISKGSLLEKKNIIQVDYLHEVNMPYPNMRNSQKTFGNLEATGADEDKLLVTYIDFCSSYLLGFLHTNYLKLVV